MRLLRHWGGYSVGNMKYLHLGNRYMQLVFTVMGSIVSCSWDGALICLASSALCVPHSVSPGKVLNEHCHTAILIFHTLYMPETSPALPG